MMRFCSTVMLAVAGTFFGPQAMADQFAERRASCTPLLTVVKEDCQIENYYRCQNDETYYEVYPLEDPIRIYLADADFRTIFGVELGTDRDLNRSTDVRDPFLLRDLLANGVERSVQMINTSILPNVEQLSLAEANYRLLAETLVIDDQEFAVIEMVETAEVGYGGQIGYGETTFVYHHETGVLTDHAQSLTLMGSTMTGLVAITRVIREGSSGFMSTDPAAICAPQLSYMTPNPALKVETTHDNI